LRFIMDRQDEAYNLSSRWSTDMEPGMKPHHRHLLPAVLACLLGMASIPATAAPFTGLVVFGDSLSDAGNNALVFDNTIAAPGATRTALPIPSPAFVPTFPYPSARYSNGPVWIEQVASNLGLSATPSLAGGTNYAFGAARSGPTGSAFPFSLRDQAAAFLADTGGTAPSGNLYVIQGGGNDARDALALFGRGGDPSALFAAFASDINAIISLIEAAGGDHILLLNVPDIGKTPAALALGPNASAAGSAISSSFNAALAAGLATLPATTRADISLLDLFSLQNEVFSAPLAYGFTDVTSPCAFSVACIANPAGSFFWDGIHPSTSGHAVIAGAALGLVPLPGTALLLGLGLLVLAALGRQRAAITKS
jgi:outer membrane lipase/esterase